MLFTVIESGFCNVAARTYIGDCWRDEPGEPQRHLFDVTPPAGFESAEIWQDVKGSFELRASRRYAIVSGNAEGRFAALIDGSMRETPLIASRVR